MKSKSAKLVFAIDGVETQYTEAERAEQVEEGAVV